MTEISQRVLKLKFWHKLHWNFARKLWQELHWNIDSNYTKVLTKMSLGILTVGVFKKKQTVVTHFSLIRRWRKKKNKKQTEMSTLKVYSKFY